MQPTTLFLDIDGVFTMLDATHLPMERVGGIHVRPIPMANALLRAINETKGVIPVWLSSWDLGAHEWNDRSGTRHWPVAYHLGAQDEAVARIGWPEFFEHDTDKKLIAAAFWLWSSRSEDHRVVWIEDGFSPETVAWAKERGNVRLIDTLKEPIRAQLLSEYEDYDKAAREFIEMCLSEVSNEMG